MTRTVICHFFNEEYLLPWWLDHHKQFFDHGIMIDYDSDDRSAAMVKEICPKWDLVKSRNQFFDSVAIDREVEDYEKDVTGWRICLNVTEFLCGNYDNPLFEVQIPIRYYLANYVFIDPFDGLVLDPALPLHRQVFWGYKEDRPKVSLSRGERMFRSIHNYHAGYPEQGGRHFPGPASFDDLFIFYYGYAVFNAEMLKRKLQIQNRMSEEEKVFFQGRHPNLCSAVSFVNQIKLFHAPRCADLSAEVRKIVLCF